jgi:SAM-dependent methyltransferase
VPDEMAMGRYYASEAYVSHTNSKKGLINGLYHRVRNITLKNKKKWIRSETGLSEGKLLDIGCGTGAFIAFMKNDGWEVTGLEPDPGARKQAVTLHGLEPLSPDAIDRLPEGSFQAITLWHVLEHVHTLHHYMERIKKLLTPTGKIFIAVPNHTSFDASYYRQHWAAWDVPRHLYHFSPDAMNHLLGMHGLRLTRIMPMWYDSFYVSLLSEKYMKRPLGPLRALLVGMISNLVAVFSGKKCSSVVYVAEKA